MARVINSNEFKELVLDAKGTVIVDFFATWCGPCKMMAPIMDELSEEAKDFAVYKIDTDESGDIAGQYNIMSIPTVIVFKDGEVYKKSVGLVSKEKLLELVK
jgi:thioredoxin 1